MKLRRLIIDRLPGIDSRFEFKVEGDGFQVVHGPNGIGKSSICRAVEALLWEDHDPIHGISLTGHFEQDGINWKCEREESKVRWQRNGIDSPPPDLPSAHLRDCFFMKLKDLIDPSTGAKDVAVEIQRQMSGGFNLPEIVSVRFKSTKKNAATKIRGEFDGATKNVLVAQSAQDSLQKEADQIHTLEEKLTGAEKDDRRLAFIQTAIKLVENQSELDDLNGRMAVLPDSLGTIRGDEQERLKSDQGKLETIKNRCATLFRDLETARLEKKESRLQAPIDSVQLLTWRSEGSGLERTELKLADLEEELHGIREKLQAAIAEIGDGDINEVEMNLEDHGQVFEFLRSAQTHQIKTREIETRLSLLANIKLDDESQKTLDQFNDGAAALRAWLRAPDPTLTKAASTRRRFWLIGAALLIASGAALAVFIQPDLGIIAGIGVGVALSQIARRSSHSGSDERLRAKTDFEKLGVETPGDWGLVEVEERLRELERKIAELTAQKTRARDRDVEAQDLKNQLDSLCGEKDDIETKRQGLLETLNLEEINGDAELVDLARAFDLLRLTRTDEKNAAGKVEAKRKKYELLLSRLGKALENHNLTKPENAAAVISGFNDLVDRNNKFNSSSSNETRILGDIENTEREITEIEDNIAGLFSSLDLQCNDVQGLAALVDQHPDYLSLGKEISALDIIIDLENGRLDAVGEMVLAGYNKEKLTQLENTSISSAHTISDFRDQIAQINESVNRAKEAHVIEHLIEKRDVCKARLEKQFNDELFDRIGCLLVHDVEQEHEKIQMPRVLERARELFSSFTHHGYEIRIGSDANDARLVAIDLRKGCKQELTELSDGTRAQLLLAARLAFAEDIERESLLPLFLDEAFDQSDPARYREMVKSLGRIVEDQGRQVFYFTSDPLDVERIGAALAEEGCNAAHSINLASVRNLAQSISYPSDLQIAPEVPIPDPANFCAEDYAVLIGVRPLDPTRGKFDQHIFYLLWDDLDFLHALLNVGIKWVGQWPKFSGSDYAAKLKTGIVSISELNSRLDLFTVFCELWNQGRGKPVYRDTIEKSGAIGDRYLEDVMTIGTEMNGNGEQIIEYLQTSDDPRLNRFRKKNTVQLEQYFRDNGHIDDRPVLGKTELLPLAIASPAAARLPNGDSPRCIHQWWELASRSIKKRIP